MSEWRPIETAPTEQDVEFLGWNGTTMVVVWAAWEENGKPVYWNGDVPWDDLTHWMPLPPPPEPVK